jgi:hypothetical protein
MARGRIISRTLGTSRRFASLQRHAGKLAEFAQALYPQVVVYADDHGREHGDAFTIKHAVWPTSHRTESDFEKALSAMHAAGLITRYEVKGVIYFQVNEFEEHQYGLHKRRKSKFPEVPGNSGNALEIPGRNEPETNRTEEEPETKGAIRRREEDGIAEFDLFYAAYPRKEKRPDALKAWQQVAPTKAEQHLILSAIARSRASPQWTKDGGMFIPLPASWLRGRRWEDQPTEVLDETEAARAVFLRGSVA